MLDHGATLVAGGVEDGADGGVLALGVGDEVGVVLAGLGEVVLGALGVAVEDHGRHEERDGQQAEDGDGDGDADAGSGAGCHIQSRSIQRGRTGGRGLRGCPPGETVRTVRACGSIGRG